MVQIGALNKRRVKTVISGVLYHRLQKIWDDQIVNYKMVTFYTCFFTICKAFHYEVTYDLSLSILKL